MVCNKHRRLEGATAYAKYVGLAIPVIGAELIFLLNSFYDHIIVTPWTAYTKIGYRFFNPTNGNTLGGTIII